MLWPIEFDQEKINYLPKLMEVLDAADFYAAHEDVFVSYGNRKRYWWKSSNAERIQQDTIDGEPINAVLQRLHRYDHANGLVRFFQRLFTSVEHQRSLVCYWAVEQLRDQLPILRAALSSDATIAVTADHQHDQSPQVHQAFQALAVLRLQTPHLKSKTLKETLSYWNLIPVLQAVMPIFDACMLQLSTLWRRTIMPILKPQTDKGRLTPLQELSHLLSTAASNLRVVCVDANLNLLAREKVIKKIYQHLKNDFNTFLADTSQTDHPELKAIYQTGMMELQAEQDRYNERLQKPENYLEASDQKAYVRQANLSLEQQWLQQDRLELDIRFAMAKKLFHQAWPTMNYEKTKGAVHNWLTAYLYPLFRSYLEPFREAKTSEEKSYYQVSHQALYQEIQLYLEAKIAELLIHETNGQHINVVSSQNRFAINPRIWLREWSELMAEILEPISSTSIAAATSSSQALENRAVVAISSTEIAPLTHTSPRREALSAEKKNESVAMNTPKTAAEWRIQYQRDIVEMQQTQSHLETEIQALVKQKEMNKAKTELMTGLEQLNKTYRELARRYHPDRWTEETVQDVDQATAKALATELFKQLTDQKNVFIQSLEQIFQPNHRNGASVSESDAAWTAACLEKIREMDVRISQLWEDFRRIREDQVKIAADQDRIATDQDRIAADQDKIAADQDRIAADQIRIAADQDRIAADQAQLKEGLVEVRSNQANNAKELDYLFSCQATQEKRLTDLERKLAQAQQLIEQLDCKPTKNSGINHQRVTFLSATTVSNSNLPLDTSEPKPTIPPQASIKPSLS